MNEISIDRQGVQLPDVCILTDRVVEAEEPAGKVKECILNSYKIQGYL